MGVIWGILAILTACGFFAIYVNFEEEFGFKKAALKTFAILAGFLMILADPLTIDNGMGTLPFLLFLCGIAFMGLGLHWETIPSLKRILILCSMGMLTTATTFELSGYESLQLVADITGIGGILLGLITLTDRYTRVQLVLNRISSSI